VCLWVVGAQAASAGSNLDPLAFVPLSLCMRDSSVTGVCPGRSLSSCRGVAVALSGGDASREFLGLPCWQAGCMARAVKQPVVLMKWYRVVS